MVGARRQAVLEGEQVCWVQRAVLCKFQLEKWSLKGWGDVLLLRDLRDLTMRLVFRKDKTGAILLDHLVQSADPTMCEMRRSSSRLNCLQWRANDESIGKLRAETISMTLPCARAASEFASAFLKAKVAANIRPQGSAHIFLSAARRDQPEQLLALWCGLEARTVVIGRPPACDISVLSSKVSGVHAEISLVKQGEAWDAKNSPLSFHVRDVSSNGTIVRFPDGSELLLKQDTCRVPQGTVLVVPASGDVEQTHLVLSVALGDNDPVPPVSKSVRLGRAAAAKSSERCVLAGNRVTSAGTPKACLAGTGLQVSAGSFIRPAQPALGSPAAASSCASRTLTVGAIGPAATDSLTTLTPAGGANAMPSAGTLSASLAGSHARVSAGSEVRPARSALGSPAAASSSASRLFAGGAYCAPSADMSRASLTAGSGVQVLASSFIRPAVVGSPATARFAERYTLAAAGAPGAAFPLGSGGARVSAAFDISGAMQRGLAACRAAARARAAASASGAPGGAARPLPPKEGEDGAASPVGKERASGGRVDEAAKHEDGCSRGGSSSTTAGSADSEVSQSTSRSTSPAASRPATRAVSRAASASRQASPLTSRSASCSVWRAASPSASRAPSPSSRAASASREASPSAPRTASHAASHTAAASRAASPSAQRAASPSASPSASRVASPSASRSRSRSRSRRASREAAFSMMHVAMTSTLPEVSRLFKEMSWMFLSNGQRGSRRKSRSEEVCGRRPKVDAASNSEGDGQIGRGGEGPGEVQRRRIRRHKRARSPQPPRSAEAGDSDEGRDAPGVDSRSHRWA